MSKEFTEVDFDLGRFAEEIARFRAMLESKQELGERELQAFFKSAPHLTANIGVAQGSVRLANLVAYEFQLMGDYAADIVLGNRGQSFCFVELEAGTPDAILTRFGKKATKEWSRDFEHGFSQIVDWFCHLDDFEKTERFHKNFGYGHIDVTGLLLIGRAAGLDDDDFRRLRWRSHHVVVNSHHVACMTYDDLYSHLNEVLDRYSTVTGVQARTARTPPTPSPSPEGDSSERPT